MLLWASGSRIWAAADFKKDIEPIMENHCYDCHADGASKGDFKMDSFTTPEARFSDRKHWMRIWENLRSHLMPPADKSQPTEEERNKLTQWIEQQVFKLDAANPDPGRVTLRRLNRQEYRYTMLDLLGVDFDIDEALPADDTGYGFDTNGDVLSISPILMEKYLDAAREIVSKSIRPQQAMIPVINIAPEQMIAEAPSKKNAQWMQFAKPAEVKVPQVIEHAGEYRITIEYRIRGSEEATAHSATMKLLVNGKDIGTQTLGWDNRKSITYNAKASLTEGENEIALAVNETSPPLEGEKQLSLTVLKISLQGPMDGRHKVFPRDYYRVFFKGAAPADPVARTVYAKEILRRLADRAYRRPVEEGTLDRLVKLAIAAANAPNGVFEDGIAQAATAILASPPFLFRAEAQAEPDNPAKVVLLDEFSLASRMSYFLWSSLPDNELYELARKGELRAHLDEQLDRMLADPKSQRFVENFVGQWLQTRDVMSVNINPPAVLRRQFDEAYRIFGERQRRALKMETESLFSYLLKENRSALEMFTADYTFLNETLAQFYGIPDVKGNEMQKISLPADSHRGGILTHGSLLVVTSNPTRTSPVKRGLFILDNFLGTPPPPPPPNVPALDDVRKTTGRGLTMRELMVVHREKPLCASCHARMDPLGLALENFNAIGQFRADERGKPIDTAGQLITGEKFTNLAELSKIFATSRHLDFYRCLSSKMLTYAIGRGTEYYDGPTIDRIVVDLEKEGGKLRTLVRGIVQSVPFQKRRGDGQH
jgi:hypothetical protein